jgi:hypothetical protein
MILHRFGCMLSVFLIITGCSTALIKAPAAVSNGRWEIKITGLADGPGQYATAGRYWRPQDGMKYIWAEITVRNSLKTDQKFHLKRIFLYSGPKRVRPIIIDRGYIFSLQADPGPRLKPGESITRRLIYHMPARLRPERMAYENTEIILTAYY